MSKEKQGRDTIGKVKAYYDHFDEWSRLDSAAGTIEKEEVLHLVEVRIPKGVHILDLGAGPGRYALEFARMGHRITLFDLSERLIDQAREKFAEQQLSASAAGFYVGNATELSVLDDEAYDAVFCCGPFYHLIAATDRAAAAREAIRVCKPGGVIMIGFIPRFSGLAGLLGRAARTEGQVEAAVFQRAFTEGVFQNAGPAGFQEGYYPTVTEMRSFWTEAGLADIEIFSTRSFIHQNEGHLLSIRERDPALYQTVIKAHREFAWTDAFIEAGGHAVLVGNKKHKE